MIQYKSGDIFQSNAIVLVNPVNTVGVMGAGLALKFRQKYPFMYVNYKRLCANHELVVGKPRLVSRENGLILLFPTKTDWREPSKLEYIEEGLACLHSAIMSNSYTLGRYSFAFPKLGCGCGQLDWNSDVKPIMEKYLFDLPCICYIYE